MFFGSVWEKKFVESEKTNGNKKQCKHKFFFFLNKETIVALFFFFPSILA